MIEPNDHLRSVHRVSERMKERSGLVCLDRNERTTPYPADVFKAMLKKFSPTLFSHYPDASPLYERLAKQLNVPEDHLHLTPGSDAAIRMLFQTYLRPKDVVLQADPSYAMYPLYTRIFQGVARSIAYDASLRLNVDAWRKALAEHPRLAVLANPDQPTGAVLTLTVLRTLAEDALKNNVLFIIDEAYYPFHPHTALELVRDFENVAVTRTFSKAGGLAGLRLGYCIARPRVIEAIARVRGAHEVNAAAIALGTFQLDHPEISKRFMADMEGGRHVLLSGCRALGIECPPCPTNFQLLRFAGLLSTADLAAALKKKGYLIKGGFEAPAIRDCIRVTLADAGTMKGFMKALTATVKEVAWKPRP